MDAMVAHRRAIVPALAGVGADRGRRGCAVGQAVEFEFTRDDRAGEVSLADEVGHDEHFSQFRSDRTTAANRAGTAPPSRRRTPPARKVPCRRIAAAWARLGAPESGFTVEPWPTMSRAAVRMGRRHNEDSERCFWMFFYGTPHPPCHRKRKVTLVYTDASLKWNRHHAISHLSQHRPDRQRGRLRSVDDFHRLVGPVHGRRGHRAHAPRLRSGHHPFRRRRHLRQRPERNFSSPKLSPPAATRSSSPRRSATTWPLTAATNAVASAPSRTIFLPTALTLATESALRRLQDRPHRPAPTPQHRHGTRWTMMPSGKRSISSSTPARSATAGSRSARPSAGCTRASAPLRKRPVTSVQHIYNLLETHPGQALHAAAESARIGTRCFSCACRTPAGCWRASTPPTPCSRRPTTASTGRARGCSTGSRKVDALRFPRRPGPHAWVRLRCCGCSERRTRGLHAAQHLRRGATRRVCPHHRRPGVDATTKWSASRNCQRTNFGVAEEPAEV